MKYKNRIIGSGEEPLDQIMFNPRNWRIHPMNQQNALKGVLEEIGWVQQVIVNKRTGNLIDGHLRCQLAAREGNDTIPVVYVDVSEEEEALILSTLDPIAGMAATDKEKLDDLFRSFNSDNENVQKLIGEIAEKEKLEFGKKPIEDVEPQIDKAEELRVKWGVESGQLWQLGEHRLICGDCTDKAVVERVMGGEKLSAMITDPPYGIAYEESKNWAKPDYVKRPVIGDNKPYDALDIWNSDIPVWCLWGANYYSNTIPVYADGNYVVWAKAHSDDENKVFGSAFELCWMYPKHKQEVWFVRRINMSGEEHGLHVTQKPIEVIERCIEYHRLGDDAIIGDFYLGSGTTLIACERLGRKCRAVEISPAYCAVAIQRWVDVTGGVPELIEHIE